MKVGGTAALEGKQRWEGPALEGKQKWHGASSKVILGCSGPGDRDCVISTPAGMGRCAILAVEEGNSRWMLCFRPFLD